MRLLKSVLMLLTAAVLCLGISSCEEENFASISSIEIVENPDEISWSEIYKTIGDSGRLYVAYYGSYTAHPSTYVTCSWKSSDSSVLEIDKETGEFRALSEGSCQVSVVVKDFNLEASCQVIVRCIQAEGISLDITEKSLQIGETVRLKATITPEDATYKDMEWLSSDVEIATVDEDGIVTAHNVGECQIIVRTFAHNNNDTRDSDDILQAECKITVNPIKSEGITLNETEKSVTIGETFTLTYTITPSDATYQDVEWSSSDNNVATVSSEGEVTAVNEGECTITVETADGKTAECEVTVVPIAVDKITLNETEKSVTIGETFTLTYTITPSDATYQDVEWSSSDNNVATVSSEGEVTAVNEGECTIYVRTSNGCSAECKVMVRIIEVDRIELDMNEKTLEEGEEFVLTATVYPDYATYKEVVWTSSDNNIATVDAMGQVYAVKVGECTISAVTSNGKSAECKVTVTPISVKSIDLSYASYSLMPGESNTFEFTVNPSNAMITDVKWEIEDESIASVSSDGTVTGISFGTTKVKVTVNGEWSDECTINVCGIEHFISLRFGSAAYSSINGYIQGNIGCIFQNNSSKEVVVKSIQIIDSASGVGGNIISTGDVLVSAKSQVAYNISIRVAVYKPIFKWVYTYQGVEYSVEKVFEGI